MNFHFFIDDKFIDDFIQEADAVSTNNVYVFTFDKPAKYVKSNRGIYANYHSEALDAILQTIQASDRVFIHWYHQKVLGILQSIPAQTTVYAMFWGGDFLEYPLRCGTNTHLSSFLFDAKSYGVYKKQYADYVRHQIKKVVRQEYKEGAWKNILSLPFKLKSKFYPIFSGPNYRKIKKEREQFLQRVSAICHWNQHDIQLLETLYGVQLNHKNFIYATGELLRTKAAQEFDEKKEMVIWVGNSDTLTNNHLEAFDVLSSLKQENIKVICPLNYGNKTYANLINKNGKEVFGDRFVGLLDFIQRESYFQLMDSVDICLMYHNRSQAGGNIFAFLQKGKKVYLKANSTIYLLLKELGFHIFSELELAKQSYEQFIEPLSVTQIEQNIALLETHLYGQDIRKKWLTELLN